MSITLDKNGSGTWALPEKRRNLKAWQRLWIVTGFIYLFLIVGAGYALMPTQERIERNMVFAVTEEMRKYDGLLFVGDSPEKTFETARSQGYAAWITGLRKRYRVGVEGNAGFDRIEREYRHAIDGLTRARLRLAAWLYLAWVAPLGTLYVMGTIVDWINRGKET